jgi:hypothetical protein
MGDDVSRVRADLGQAEDLLDRDALPVGVELRPAGDAVDVGVDRLAWQRLERRPVEGERSIDLAPDADVPRGEVCLRDRAVVEDRNLSVLYWPGGMRSAIAGSVAVDPKRRSNIICSVCLCGRIVTHRVRETMSAR